MCNYWKPDEEPDVLGDVAFFENECLKREPVPVPFPSGVVLKVAVDGSTHARLYQAGRELRRGKDGIYSVAFDARELVVKGQL